MITSWPLHASARGSGSLRMAGRFARDHAAGSDANVAGTDFAPPGSTFLTPMGVPIPDPVTQE